MQKAFPPGVAPQLLILPAACPCIISLPKTSVAQRHQRDAGHWGCVLCPWQHGPATSYPGLRARFQLLCLCDSFPQRSQNILFSYSCKGTSISRARILSTCWSDGLKLINGGHNHFWLLCFSWLLYCFDLQYELAHQHKEAWQVWYSRYIKEFRGRCQKEIASVNKIYTTWTRRQFIFCFEDV